MIKKYDKVFVPIDVDNGSLPSSEDLIVIEGYEDSKFYRYKIKELDNMIVMDEKILILLLHEVAVNHSKFPSEIKNNIDNILEKFK